MSQGETQNQPFDAFLSHSSEDKEIVEVIACKLREHKINPWFDKWHLIPGQSSSEGIAGGLQASRSCVVFLGPSGLGPWHNLEQRAALKMFAKSRGKYPLIPVLLPGAKEPSEAVPLLFQDITWVSFPSLDDDEAIKRLVCGINGVPPITAQHQPGKSDDVPVKIVNPYQVAAALRSDHPTYIRRSVDEEFSKALHGSKTLIAICGEWGIGKSSLMLQATKLLTNHVAFGGGLADMRSEDATRFMNNFFKLFKSQFGAIDDWDQLEVAIRKCPSVLFLDDLGEVQTPGLEALIPGLIQTFGKPNSPLRVIVTSPLTISKIFERRGLNPKYGGQWDQLTVPPCKSFEWRHLLNLLTNRAREVAVRMIDQIEAKSSLEPQRLQRLCSRLFDADTTGSPDWELESLVSSIESYEE